MSKNRVSDCHPEIPHQGYGLCRKCYQEKYREKNREALQKRKAEYSENNRDEIARKSREYHGENRDRILDYQAAYREKPSSILRRLVYHAQRRAEQKGLQFDIAEEDLVIPEKCPLLEIPLFYKAGKIRTPNPNAPSLDRKDSSKGYTKDNVWVISDRANRIKRDATTDELVLLSKNLQEKTK
jgi:hypothetical protein